MIDERYPQRVNKSRKLERFAKLYRAGYRREDICERLCISYGTYNNYKRQLFGGKREDTPWSIAEDGVIIALREFKIGYKRIADHLNRSTNSTLGRAFRLRKLGLPIPARPTRPRR